MGRRGEWGVATAPAGSLAGVWALTATPLRRGRRHCNRDRRRAVDCRAAIGAGGCLCHRRSCLHRWLVSIAGRVGSSQTCRSAGGVGLGVVDAAQIDSELGVCALPAPSPEAAPSESRANATDAGDGKLRQPMPQAGQPMLAFAIERDSAVPGALSGTLNEIGQNCAGSTSTKVRTPAAYMASICSEKRTGSAIWLASVSNRMASGTLE